MCLGRDRLDSWGDRSADTRKGPENAISEPFKLGHAGSGTPPKNGKNMISWWVPVCPVWRQRELAACLSSYERSCARGRGVVVYFSFAAPAIGVIGTAAILVGHVPAYLPSGKPA